MIYGYARVSTDGQSVDAQVKQLRDAGAEKVFRETASGAKSDRAQLRRALAALDKGASIRDIKSQSITPNVRRPPVKSTTLRPPTAPLPSGVERIVLSPSL